MNDLEEYKEEKVIMIDENTEVAVLGFPDPVNPNVFDFKKRCLLKDSLRVMNERLDEIDFEKELYRYYDFSVLCQRDERSYTDLPPTFDITVNDKLVYTYDCDKRINVSEEFEGLLHFTDDCKVKVTTKDE